jgi:hypothetical protein
MNELTIRLSRVEAAIVGLDHRITTIEGSVPKANPPQILYE